MGTRCVSLQVKDGGVVFSNTRSGFKFHSEAQEMVSDICHDVRPGLKVAVVGLRCCPTPLLLGKIVLLFLLPYPNPV